MQELPAPFLPSILPRFYVADTNWNSQAGHKTRLDPGGDRAFYLAERCRRAIALT